MEKNVSICLLLALAAAPQPLAAQTAQPEFVISKPQDESGQTTSPTAPNANSYKVGLNDEVKITVFDESNLTAMYRVDADGSISFPLIGPVPAAGTTLAELQQRIATMLAAGYCRSSDQIGQFGAVS